MTIYVITLRLVRVLSLIDFNHVDLDKSLPCDVSRTELSASTPVNRYPQGCTYSLTEWRCNRGRNSARKRRQSRGTSRGNIFRFSLYFIFNGPKIAHSIYIHVLREMYKRRRLFKRSERLRGSCSQILSTSNRSVFVRF